MGRPRRIKVVLLGALTLAGRLGAAIVAGVFLIAAASKLLDLGGFAEGLQQWTLIPHGLQYPIAIAVPCTEVVVALWWFLGLGRVQACVGMIVLLCCFAGAYAVQSAFARPPDCGCFGLLMRYERAQRVAQHVIVRDLIMAAIVGVGLFPIRVRSGS